MTTIKRQQWKQATIINDNNARCRSGKSGLLTGNGWCCVSQPDDNVDSGQEVS